MKVEEVKRLLSVGYIYVEFIKKNGELRKMWCTRDNRIIKALGHEIVQFHHWEIRNREKKYPHLVYVFDLQEMDTRILNVKTMREGTLKWYKEIGEVEIPKIKTRFEKKAEEMVKNREEELEKEVANVEIEDLFK